LQYHRYWGESVSLPAFTAKKQIELELDLEGLRSFIKKNVMESADIEIVENKIYIKVPLDAVVEYEVKNGKVIVKVPVK
jgi:hypothetical protein